MIVMFDYTQYKYRFKEQKDTYNDLTKDYNTETKKIRLLSQLAIDKDIFTYYGYINSLIYDIKDFNEDYLKILERIADKLKTDLAQGNFISTLIKIGTDKGLSLYKYILKHSKGDVLLEYSGLIYGGYYLKHNRIPGSLFSINDNSHLNIKNINAILVIYENESTLPKKLYSFLESISNIPELNYHLANLCFVFYNKKEKYFYDLFKKLISKNDVKLSQYIFNRFTYQKNLKLSNFDFYNLVSIIKEYNIDIIDEIISNFIKYNDIPKNVDLIIKWFTQNNQFYLDCRKLIWVLKEITVNEVICENYLDEFAKQYMPLERTLGFFVCMDLFYEKIFEVFVKNNVTLVISKLEEFYKNKLISKDAYFKFANLIVSQLYLELKQSNSSDISTFANYILNKFQLTPFLDVPYKEITKKIKSWIEANNFTEVLKELRSLINLSFTLKNNYDINKMKDILKQPELKNINDILYDEVIKYNYDKKIFSPLFWMIYRYKDRISLSWPEAYLNELDECIINFKNKFPNTINNKIKDIRSYNKFWPTYSELMFINKFKLIKCQEVNANTNGNTDFDLKCNINNKNMWFELTTPDNPDYWNLGSGVGAIGNRTANIIAKKVEPKISSNLVGDVLSGFNKDLYFIVIDATNAIDINDYNIEGALFGDLQYQFSINKNTGCTVGDAGLTRKNNGVVCKNYDKFKVISGIIYFRKELDYFNGMYKIKLMGDIIQNPNAINKMDKFDYIALKKILFG